MADIHALPAHGDVFLDARDDGRAMRLSWHTEAGGMAVLSIWRAGTCVSTFQLGREDIPDLIDTLVRGLAEDQAQHRTGQAS
ncbi:hypothetical protein [Nocardioides marmorisolisilvae]|uniref:Uncharacterized protein n=1 Tax=Nocardioides marmorisolisilvae TaxID=1542737 RepID=A0A3N0DTL0_9ACTN|nr:hypothetical protein [Nocardioides marmorisolisilvae]RNL78826.1 hypothetical protein EFL95_07105 [Nocardioides marmorisolisilvae]